MTKPAEITFIAANLFRGLVEHLRDSSNSFLRPLTVKRVNFDPTYGDSESEETIDAIDFECLLAEIDKFAETFITEPSSSKD